MAWKLRSRAKPWVINYFPRYKSDPRVEMYSDYCRVKLMLHHPFVDWDDLLLVGDQIYGSYVDAFHACTCQHMHPEDFYADPEESGEGPSSDTDSDSDYTRDEGSDDNYPLVDFEVFARWRPQGDFPHMDISEGLGHRDLDRDHDWSVFFDRYNHLYNQ